MLRFLPDVLEVSPGCPDVGSGQVPPAQSIHETAVGPHQRFGLPSVGIANYDGLAAAEVETSGGRLVGHGLGQAKSVCQGLGLALVGPHAGTTARRPEGCVMNGYDCPEPGAGVGKHHDLLMAPSSHSLENVHFRYFLYVFSIYIIQQRIEF